MITKLVALVGRDEALISLGLIELVGMHEFGQALIDSLQIEIQGWPSGDEN